MDKEQKSFIFNIRKNLERGEAPTTKSVHKLLELVNELDRQLRNEKVLLTIQLDVTQRLEARLESIKETVIEKIEEAFV